MNCCAGWKILGSDVSLGHFSFVLAATNLDAGRLFWIFSLLEPDSHLAASAASDGCISEFLPRCTREKGSKEETQKGKCFFSLPARH